MKIKKMIVFTIIILLFFGLCTPLALAMDNDVFCLEEVAANAEYDGFLFKTVNELDEMVLDSYAGISQVSDGLYHADTVMCIEQYVPANNVEYIEPNYLVYLDQSTITVNDPLYESQWNLDMIDANALWKSGLSGKGAVIGIIDSGLAAGHEDINYANVAAGENFIDGNADTTDNTGHGTAVTGIISALRNNGKGIAGIADGATIVPLKAFSSDSQSVNTIIKAIYAAVDTYGCDVLNMSFSTASYSESLYEAICYAYEKNVIMVAAVGNYGSSGLRYPAAFDQVIGVGGVQVGGDLYRLTTQNESVFVTAPASNVLTLTVDSGYGHVSGTSFATPHVTAMAALARSYDPDFKLSDFRELLIESSAARGGSTYNISYGYGIVNLRSFIYGLTGEEWVYYDDLDEGYWAENSIGFVIKSGLFTATSTTTFSPESHMTRAMFATILGRLYETDGNIPDANDSFTDTAPGSYYSKYVAWLARNGIMDGYGDGLFGPDDSVTLEQAAVILYRYACFTGAEKSTADPVALYGYAGAPQLSLWAQTGMAWAIHEGIVPDTFPFDQDPQAPVTRAQCAVIFQNFMENYSVPSAEEAAA